MESLRARVTRLAQSPPVMRAVFAVARRWKPVFALGGRTIVCTHADVADVLARDREFSVVPAYARKMQQTSGDFFLGMDDGPEYRREVGIMRRATRADDSERIRAFVGVEAAAAVARGRRRGWLDAVGELTRRVPIRLVDHYFGVPAPDEATMAYWMRILFDVLFFDIDGEKLAEGEAAAARLNAWVGEVIERRRGEIAAGSDRDDLLTRLLRMQADPETHLDDTGIRRNINGLIIGSVDSTCKAAANSLAQLLARPAALAGARRAAQRGDHGELRGWIYDALRFDPLGLAVPRHAAADVSIGTGRGRRTLAAGAPIWAFIFSAMFDGAALESPGEIRPDRPGEQYLHFGFGLHACFGRHINAVTLPALLAPLLAEPGIYAEEPLRMAGPFPDRLLVGFDRIER
jgi:cytochrome P450